MNVEDLVLVSVDDHIIEPREMFDAHIPDRYRDRAPRVLTDDDGSEYWLFEGERAAYMGLNAVAGCPPEEYGLNPTRYDQMRKGCYDVDERVRDMNANGVLGSLELPDLPAFLRAALRPPAGQGPVAGGGPGVQRLAYRRVVRRTSGAFHSLWRHPLLGPGSHGRRGPSDR